MADPAAIGADEGGGDGRTTVADGMEGDALLVARLVAGDDGAVGELFDRYGALVFGLARRVTGSTTVAEDVVQEVFTRLWTNPERFDAQRGSLRAYLGVQAHRRAVDALRSDQRRRGREETWAAPERVVSASTADAAEGAATAEVVREAIARLPDEQRVAVELVFWHGHTYREVAAVLAIPEGTAKSRLRLAQAKLATWLRPLQMELA